MFSQIQQSQQLILKPDSKDSLWDVVLRPTVIFMQGGNDYQ